MATRSFTQMARSLLDGGFNPFEPEALARLTGGSDFARFAAELPDGVRQEDILAILRIMAVDAEIVREAREPQVVATFPRSVRANVRRTAPVVRELLGSASREILAVGYTLTDQEFVGALIAARRRGVEVIVVADRNQGSAEGMVATWPPGLSAPTCYVDADGVAKNEMASMHSKLLVVDATELLVTSANFTWLGHNENIEFGIRVSGNAAMAARNFFQRLMGCGVLVPLDRLHP